MKLGVYIKGHFVIMNNNTFQIRYPQKMPHILLYHIIYMYIHIYIYHLSYLCLCLGLWREVTPTSLRMWSLSEPWGIQTCQNFLSTTHFCLGKCKTAPPSDLVQNRGPPRGAAVFLTGGKIECENGPVHLFHLPPAASCRISSPAWWFLSTTTVSSSPPSRSAWFFETCNSCPAWPRRCVDGFCCLKIPLNLRSCYFI